VALSDIVQVQVNINTSTVAQQGFGTPLIYAHHPFPERVLSFKASGWSAQMVAAGFNVASAAYRTAAEIMAQSPRPVTFKVGRRTDPDTQVVAIIPIAAMSALGHVVTVVAPDGTTETGTFVSDASATVAEIATGVAAVINAMAAAVTAVPSATEVVVTADATDRIYSYTLGTNLRLEDRSVVTAANITTDLNAIEEEDGDWYALALASSAPDAIKAVADWVEGHGKIFVASTHDSRPLTNATDDVVSYVQDEQLSRTHVAYNSRAGDFYGAGWSAALLPYEPGQADWKFKVVRGAQTDKLTPQQETYLLGKGGSYYERVIEGANMTGAAKGGDGMFLDLVQLKDWMTARVTEGIVGMLAASPKVSFTDQGAGNSIWGVLKNVVERGIQNDAIDGDPDTYSIYVPKRAELDPADRAARRWPGCVLNVTPTGAIHSVGVLTINLNVAG
jgi:hypothetical protein